MSKKHVLMVYMEPTPYIVRLIRELMLKTDWRVDVLFIFENHSQKWNVELAGINFEVLPEGLWETFRVLSAKLLGGHYDVLHLAGWGHSHMLAALFAGRRAAVPVLMETDTPLPYQSSSLKRIVKRLVYPWLFRLTTKFLPGGSQQARYLRHYKVASNKIQIAYMTVDTAQISDYVDRMPEEQRLALRSSHQISEQGIVFLYVGRMEPHKGIRELLDGFEQVWKTSPDCHLVLVGDGSIRDEAARSAANHKNIHYLGRLSGNELLNAYALSDVFVLPSLFEPWGLVVNEAMAAELAVIVSDRAGCIDDLIIPGETGFVVEAESSERLATTMRRFAVNPDLVKSIGLRARQHIRPWTTARRANVMHKIWQEVSV